MRGGFVRSLRGRIPEALSWRPLSEQGLSAGRLQGLGTGSRPVPACWSPQEAGLLQGGGPIFTRIQTLAEQRGKSLTSLRILGMCGVFTAGPEGSLPSPLLRVEHVPSSSSLCLWGGAVRTLTPTAAGLSAPPGSYGSCKAREPTIRRHTSKGALGAGGGWGVSVRLCMLLCVSACLRVCACLGVELCSYVCLCLCGAM